MTDAHFHRNVYDAYLSLDGREWRFCGVPPWQTGDMQCEGVGAVVAGVEADLAQNVHAGVGEIGLDRLRAKTIPPAQRAAFERQLALAAALARADMPLSLADFAAVRVNWSPKAGNLLEACRELNLAPWISAGLTLVLGFFGALLMLLLFVCSNVFAYVQKQGLTHRTGAIIMAPAATVKSTPAKQGTDLFILHEGTRVEITDGSMRQWKRVSVADGKEGWIETSQIEII